MRFDFVLFLKKKAFPSFYFFFFLLHYTLSKSFHALVFFYQNKQLTLFASSLLLFFFNLYEKRKNLPTSPIRSSKFLKIFLFHHPHSLFDPQLPKTAVSRRVRAGKIHFRRSSSRIPPLGA